MLRARLAQPSGLHKGIGGEATEGERQDVSRGIGSRGGLPAKDQGK